MIFNRDFTKTNPISNLPVGMAGKQTIQNFTLKVLARKSVELVRDSVQLRIILAKLYMHVRHCPLALPHLDYAHDLIDPKSGDVADIRHRLVIVRMRNLCS